jgi:hypothetical protein
MKSGLVAAWIAGELLVVWRVVHRDHRMPVPGQLLGVSALFLGLAAVAEYSPAAGLATAVAWGLDVAALFNALPAGLAGQISKAQASSAGAEGFASQGTGQNPNTANITSRPA